MSNIFKPVTIPNLSQLQGELLSFIASQTLILSNGSFLTGFGGAVPLSTLPNFKACIEGAGFNMMDFQDGAAFTAQSETMLSTIYSYCGPDVSNGIIYYLQIPLMEIPDAKINFYSVSSPGVEKTTSGHAYLQYEPESCTLLESHSASGPCIFNCRVPRAIENNPDTPRHHLTLKISAASNDYVAELFGFTPD